MAVTDDLDLVVVSFHGLNVNDGTDYEAGFAPGREWGLPDAQVVVVQPTDGDPHVAAVEQKPVPLNLYVKIVGPNLRALRDQLLYAFDTRDGVARELIVQDKDGADSRSVQAVCKQLRPRMIKATASAREFQVSLIVDGDVRWRRTTRSQVLWSVTGSPDSQVVDNPGSADAYPVYTVKPTSSKTGGYAHKRWVPVRWLAPRDSGGLYPVLLGTADTAALVTAGRAQADGDDWRVTVDGEEVDRWFGDSGTAQFNQTDTKTWVNMEFLASQSATLKVAIGAGDTITSIDVNQDISNWPDSGILHVDDEAFTYESKSNAARRFLGVIRARKGTTADDHAAGATAHWIQHDVWILYGNPTAGAPTIDDDFKPAIDLTDSDNSHWRYVDVFGEDDGLRVASWESGAVAGSPFFYTHEEGSSADPWDTVGIYWVTSNGGYWRVYNPCGIVDVSVTGKKRHSDTTMPPDTSLWSAAWQDSVDGQNWNTIDTESIPHTPNVWIDAGVSTYGPTYDVTPGALWFRMLADVSVGADNKWLEIRTIYLDLDDHPTASIGSEQGNYALACTIENQTTGESISLTHTMELNADLEVDTDDKTVVDLADGLAQIQALTLDGGPRQEWLKLVPGSNTLTYNETGVVGVTVTVDFAVRDY